MSSTSLFPESVSPEATFPPCLACSGRDHVPDDPHVRCSGCGAEHSMRDVLKLGRGATAPRDASPQGGGSLPTEPFLHLVVELLEGLHTSHDRSFVRLNLTRERLENLVRVVRNITAAVDGSASSPDDMPPSTPAYHERRPEWTPSFVLPVVQIWRRRPGAPSAYQRPGGLQGPALVHAHAWPNERIWAGVPNPDVLPFPLLDALLQASAVEAALTSHAFRHPSSLPAGALREHPGGPLELRVSDYGATLVQVPANTSGASRRELESCPISLRELEYGLALLSDGVEFRERVRDGLARPLDDGGFRPPEVFRLLLHGSPAQRALLQPTDLVGLLADSRADVRTAGLVACGWIG